MDLKTLIEKLLTAAPPGAVVEEVLIRGYGVDIIGIWYDQCTSSIVIQRGNK